MDRFFPQGVRPHHLAALGVVLIFGGLALPGVAVDGVIILIVADIWWAVDRLPRRNGSGTGSGSGTSGAT